MNLKHYSGRSCEIFIKKKPMVGNMVSHSQRKTKRLYHVNLHSKNFHSKLLNMNFKLLVSNCVIRTFMKYGASFDEMLLNSKRGNLTQNARKIRKEIFDIKNKTK